MPCSSSSRPRAGRAHRAQRPAATSTVNSATAPTHHGPRLVLPVDRAHPLRAPEPRLRRRGAGVHRQRLRRGDRPAAVHGRNDDGARHRLRRPRRIQLLRDPVAWPRHRAACRSRPAARVSFGYRCRRERLRTDRLPRIAAGAGDLLHARHGAAAPGGDRQQRRLHCLRRVGRHRPGAAAACLVAADQRLAAVRGRARSASKVRPCDRRARA